MTSSPRGRLVALEGIDGCGKSTQARILAESLGALLTAEPGATELGRSLRAILLDPARPAPVPRAEALLMAADRAQHVDQIVAPALREGRWVVTDRFSGSTLAYQGWGRGLTTEPLRQMVGWAAGGIEADLSVLIDVPVDVARRRMGSVSPDRLERLDPEFHERVRHGFVALAGADPGHWVVIDGTPAPDRVADSVTAEVTTRLGSPGVVPR